MNRRRWFMLLSATMLLAAAVPAMAQVAIVTDPLLMTFLETGFPTSPGNGLLQTLVSIDSKLGQSVAQAQIAPMQQLKDNELLAYKKMIIDQKLKDSLNYTQFNAACWQLTQAETNNAAMATTHAGKGAFAAAGAAIYNAAPPSPQAATVQALLAGAAQSCTWYDINVRKVPWCTGKTPGPAAGANTTALSLTEGNPLAGTAAQSGPNATGPAMQPNHSLTPQQAQATESYINTVLPPAVAQPSVNVINSRAGTLFMAHWNAYNARMSTAQTALDNIAALSVAMPANDPALAAWNSQMKADFVKLYPNVTPPTAPSERDLLNVEVDNAYANDISLASTAVDDPVERTKLMAIQDKLLLLLLNRTEDQNAMLAAILSNQVQPITAAALSVPPANPNSN